MADSDDFERELDELYEGEPGAFVAARNALAKRLRVEGRRDDAARVTQLRRPSNAAAALNRTARARPDRVDALVAAGSALRDAQVRSLQGGAADALRDAVAARRALTQELADDAVRRIDAEGGAGENARDEINATLEAASLDESVAAQLRAGRLDRTVAAPSGFDLLPDAPLPPASRADRRTAATPRTAPAARRDEPSVAQVDDAAAKRAARAAERARALRADADEAHAQLASARAEVDRLDRDLRRAQRRLQDAEARARRADELAQRAGA
jgi:hypothetical protein